MKRVALLFLLILSTPSWAGLFFNKSVADWYIGGRLGKISSNTKDTEGQFGFGADVGMRVAKATHLSLSYQNNLHPDRPNGTLHSLTPGVEFFPFASMTEMRASIGLGLGAYQLMGNERLTQLGVNFGLGIDVLVRGFRIGLVSRYHSMFDTKTLPDFWNFMFRVGFEIKS